MLENLKKYENLGTPKYFWILLNQLKNNDLRTEKNIKSYFFNKIIDNKSIFDGCLPLLKLSKIIKIDNDTSEVIVDYSYKNILYNEELCKHTLLEGFLLSFYKEENFYEIFSSKNTSYDIDNNVIQIKYSAFNLWYANIRQLLIDFNFLSPHPKYPQHKLIVNSQWKSFFDKYISTEIRKRKIWIDELKKILEEQEKNWEIAEKFILNYENKRLKDKKGIEWIAPFDVWAGYDILSYNNCNSTHQDRFIEVKSYIWDIPSFYWSKNEFETAKKNNDNYFLYLVDRNRINELWYEPIIISKAYDNIINNDEWIKKVDKYYIIYKN